MLGEPKPRLRKVLSVSHQMLVRLFLDRLCHLCCGPQCLSSTTCRSQNSQFWLKWVSRFLVECTATTISQVVIKEMRWSTVDNRSFCLALLPQTGQLYWLTRDPDLTQAGVELVANPTAFTPKLGQCAKVLTFLRVLLGLYFRGFFVLFWRFWACDFFVVCEHKHTYTQNSFIRPWKFPTSISVYWFLPPCKPWSLVGHADNTKRCKYTPCQATMCTSTPAPGHQHEQEHANDLSVLSSRRTWVCELCS